MPPDPLTFEDYQRRRYFPALDGLRALSVLIVVLHHERTARLWRWVHGANGVTVFFVVSGFLITTLALREEARRGSLDLRAFYLRRVFRLVPLYALVLSAYCALILGIGVQSGRRAAFLRALPYYVTYLQEVPHFAFPGVPFEVSWSLGVEEKFYLVWPLLAFVAARARPAARLWGTLVLTALLFAAPAVAPAVGRFSRRTGTSSSGARSRSRCTIAARSTASAPSAGPP